MLALAAVVAELVLRLLGISHPLFFQADPLTGLGHIPLARGWYTEEGRAHVRINAAGWRDGERSTAKVAGVVRVAVLGDSYTEALQVAEQARFTSVLERELNAQGRGRFEVLNFGVSGFGTGQELLALRERVLAYAPDVVLLAFVTGNDVSDNVRELRGVDYVPYFRLQGERLVLDDSHRDSPGFRARSSAGARFFVSLAAYSRLLQLVNHWRRGRAAAERPGAVRGVEAEALPAPSSGVYLESPPGSWTGAWRLTERLLRELRDACRARGASFSVVTLSNPEQVDPRPQRRDTLAGALGVTDLFHPERRVQAMGLRVGFEVLTLAPELAAHAVRTGEYLHGFAERLGRGHWNERGHELAGRSIAAWLRGLVGTPVLLPGSGGTQPSER